MLHPVPTLKESPSQTAGPYVHIGLTPNFADIAGIYATDPGATMLGPDTPGQRIAVSGRIIDGAGVPVGDAVVECWQADADGRYGAGHADANAGNSFTGWGRQPTNAQGVFTFETIKPGRAAGPDGKLMAPHIALWIVARGINTGLQMRYYFDDEAGANAEDFLLNKIPDARRRATLIASRQPGDGLRYHLDIHLQGDQETVFLDM